MMETPAESVRARVSSVTFYNVTQTAGRWWAIWVVGIVPIKREDVETLIVVQACQPPLGGSLEPPVVNAPSTTELNFLGGLLPEARSYKPVPGVPWSST